MTQQDLTKSSGEPAELPPRVRCLFQALTAEIRAGNAVVIVSPDGSAHICRTPDDLAAAQAALVPGSIAVSGTLLPLGNGVHEPVPDASEVRRRLSGYDRIQDDALPYVQANPGLLPVLEALADKVREAFSGCLRELHLVLESRQLAQGGARLWAVAAVPWELSTEEALRRQDEVYSWMSSLPPDQLRHLAMTYAWQQDD